MRIIQLKAENIKRLVAVDITPQGDLVVITGKNSQGKTSVLDAIWLALSSQAVKTIQAPVRKGQQKAFVELDLGEYLVRRHWTDPETSYLKVETKDGIKKDSPQKVLDGLVGSISFDPLQFSRLKAKEQREVLLDIVKLPKDPALMDLEKQKAYDDRTGVNRQVKEVVALMNDMERFVDDSVPDERVSIQALLDEHSKASAKVNENFHLRKNAEQLADEVLREQKEVENQEERLKHMRKVLAEQKAKLLKAQEAVAKAVDPDLKEIKAKIESSESTNRKVEQKKRYKSLDQQKKDLEAAANKLTLQIEWIESEKVKMLEEAKFPLGGLAVNADSVTFLGIPFNQCAASEQLKISLAIAMTLNPKLKVIRITDGSLLDDENLELVRSVAEQNDYQVWLEKVDGKSGIRIEEGLVKEGQE